MDQEYASIQDAAVLLGVDETILESLVTDLIRTNRIKSKIVDGERRVLLSTLINVQQQDPTLEGRKQVERQIVAPATVVRRTLLHRRAVLIGVGVVGTSLYDIARSFLGGLGAQIVANPIKHQTDEDWRKDGDAAEALKLFDELFGCIDESWSINLGKKYATGGQKTYHQDHIVTAAAILNSRPLLALSDSLSALRGGLSLPVKGDYLVVGGPISTPVVNRAWQYETGRSRSVKRVKEPLLRLPYSFLIDPADSRLSNLHRVAWKMAGNSVAVPASNRLLLNSDFPKHQHFAEKSRMCLEVGGVSLPVPNTNDLLITRLPNFLSSAYKDARGNHPVSWGCLVVVQGTHGIGTRAVELLLTHKGKAPLLAMKSQVSNAPAYQSHFKVRNPELTREGFHRFTDIEHVRSVPLDIPLLNYAAIRRELEKEFSEFR
jgi:hypothetical protein